MCSIQAHGKSQTHLSYHYCCTAVFEELANHSSASVLLLVVRHCNCVPGVRDRCCATLETPPRSSRREGTIACIHVPYQGYRGVKDVLPWFRSHTSKRSSICFDRSERYPARTYALLTKFESLKTRYHGNNAVRRHVLETTGNSQLGASSCLVRKGRVFTALLSELVRPVMGIRNRTLADPFTSTRPLLRLRPFWVYPSPEVATPAPRCTFHCCYVACRDVAIHSSQKKFK